MILIVDDDNAIVESLGLMLKRAGLTSKGASSPADALSFVQDPEIELVIQDMNFSRRTTGEEGLELLTSFRSIRPGLPIVLITAWGSIELAVEGMRRGAVDFVTKPWSNEQVLHTVNTALGLAAVSKQEDAPQREELDAHYDFGEIVGQDPALLRVLELVGRVATTDASVLITGESGTGKELVASALHRNSRRAGQPFVKVNLGGLTSSLFESELFGHVRGAFTDAHRDREGRFSAANGGSIFLDEIGEVPPTCQVKLLRVLQERQFEPVGSSRTLQADVRVISATNRDLDEEVKSGRFREDLLYRLNLIAVRLPSLAERLADLPVLVQNFAARLAQQYDHEELRITPDAIHWLQGRRWPGNIRQLRQVLERTVLVSGRSVLDVPDFEQALSRTTTGSEPDALPAVGAMTLDEMERAMIRKALRHHNANITHAADSLGMSRAALYRRLEKYGIDP